MKLVALILSLLVLSSTVVPCYVIDNCDQEEQTSGSASHEEEEGDCSDCSPFSICSLEGGISIPVTSFTIEVAALAIQPVYCEVSCPFEEGFYSSPFLPPRLI